MKEIDLSSWPRREIFEFFSRTSRPFYSLNFNLDIKKALNFAKKRGLSFYYCMIWLVTKAVNAVEAFRYTLRDGRVFLLERREPSFTDLRPGGDYFHICTMSCGEDIASFCAEAAKKSKNQQEFINYSDERSDLIYISCLPWLELTSLTNEGELERDDCIPRISWGKFVPRGGELILNFSLEVNHRFIDGAHAAAFAEALRKAMDALPE